MVTICTASLTFNNSTFCPHTVFICFVWISEQTAIISLYKAQHSHEDGHRITENSNHFELLDCEVASFTLCLPSPTFPPSFRLQYPLDRKTGVSNSLLEHSGNLENRLSRRQSNLGPYSRMHHSGIRTDERF